MVPKIVTQVSNLSIIDHRVIINVKKRRRTKLFSPPNMDKNECSLSLAHTREILRRNSQSWENKCGAGLTVIMKKLITAKERERLRVVIREQVVITAGAKKHVHNTLSACSNTMATAHYCFIN
jgi:hypothetical protein